MTREHGTQDWHSPHFSGILAVSYRKSDYDLDICIDYEIDKEECV
jgi:hypothetical protein